MAVSTTLTRTAAILPWGVSEDDGVPKLSPVAYQIQGYKLNRAIFNPTAARLGQAIVGEMSLDDALKRISADA